MTTLTAFKQAEQPHLGTVLAETGEPIGNLEPGDLVTHCQYNDFRGRVIQVDNGHCQVEVLDGWRGPPPTWPVTIPTTKLMEVTND